MKNVKNDNAFVINKYVYFIVALIIIFIITFMGFVNYINKNDDYNKCFDINYNKNDNFVFLGDSITEQYSLDEYYLDLPAVNSGVGGNTTDDILSDMKNRVYQYNPTKVFILVGINDLKHEKKPEYIFKNINKIVDNIKENRPNTKIYVESIYPINDSDDEKVKEDSIRNRNNNDIDKINSMLKEKYNNTDVTYIDINSNLKENNKLKLSYTVDGVHLTPLGYIKVTRLLMPYLINN
ncbi:MAG: hypothetical protein IJ105_00710 [Bacilli bacterium]|nr:hypothetical protein [Bacilli bacterium]